MAKPGLTLDSNTVFLITGAAGSIVSAITADLGGGLRRHVLPARSGARA